MSNIATRFLRYVKLDTQSRDGVSSVPSTPGQLNLARLLCAELEEMGASDVVLDDTYGYVYASIPATTQNPTPVLGFIAHMDTSPDCSGKNIKPQIISNYAGNDIDLGNGVVLSAKEFSFLQDWIGQDIITTDGTTLLGADDKAGIAEIMEMTQYLLQHAEIAHGMIKICFTPDEEIGHGVDHFNLAQFGAQYAYTVDGGPLGELSLECFNAAHARIVIRGRSIHPGQGKGQMRNALLIAHALQAKLPASETPANTEGRAGFFHLCSVNGEVAHAEMTYLIRDHDRAMFASRKELLSAICQAFNETYGEDVVTLELTDSYYNMGEIIEREPLLLTKAIAAMHALGILPDIVPIRGGTDGARLSFLGLPCPNLGTGGHNFHGPQECISIQAMERTVQLLVRLTEEYAN